MVTSKTFFFNQSINILATLISGYLLYDDFCLFTSKPTHFSKSNEILGPKHIPDFYICPIPAFDLNNLKKHGYSSGYTYMKGTFINYARLRGWNGNSSDTNQTFLDDISAIKVVNDCPRFTVLFQHNFESNKAIFGSFTLTNPIFPNGRCCKVFFDEKEKISRLMRVAIKVDHLNNFPSLFEGFRLFMINKENSHVLKLGNSNKNGFDLKAMLNDTGSKYYSVKIIEEFDLEEDPKVSCKNYANPHGYGEVLIFHQITNM